MRLCSTLFLAFFAATSFADDWPQWMGPNRDGVWAESGIVETLGKEPNVIWRAPINGGYAGPAVANGRLFVTDYERREGEVKNDPGTRVKLQGNERILCLDATTGEKIWERSYDCPYSISYPVGPRATPTVDGEHVYSLGAEGKLMCLKVENGDNVWSQDLKSTYKTESPIWGFAAHPLVDGDKLICMVGGEGSVAVAFDKKTGKELWRSLTAQNAGYCPPSIINAGGTRQLIIFDPQHVNGLNPETGEVHWSIPFESGYGMSINAPQKFGDHLFVSAIGNKAAVLKLAADKPDAEILWEATSAKEGLFTANSTSLVVGDTVYGTDCSQGSLIAADLKTGKRLWSTFKPTTGERRAGHGTAFLVRNDDRFFLFGEQGDLIIARLTPEKYEELSRVHILEPTSEAFGRKVVWSHPAFANKSIYARNDKEIVCVSLAQ